MKFKLEDENFVPFKVTLDVETKTDLAVLCAILNVPNSIIRQYAQNTCYEVDSSQQIDEATYDLWETLVDRIEKGGG